MKRLTDEEFDALINKNEMIKYAVSELEQIFKINFCLTEQEMKQSIIDIVSNFDEELVLKLTDVFQHFVDNDIPEYDIKERNAFAKRTIKYCVELYYKDSNAILDDFMNVLKEAKEFKIDPFKLAIKGNLSKASSKTFNKSLTALVESDYIDLLSGKTYKLFELDEVKSIFEQCASIATGLNEKRVQRVLDLLSEFVYDDEMDGYVVSPKSLIQKSYRLLQENPQVLNERIQFIIDSFIPKRMNKRELILRIAESPSILLCSPEKFIEYEDVLAKSIFEIMNSEGFTGNNLSSAERMELAKSYADKYCYNLDNFNTINSINKSSFVNIEKIRDILVENLGANNALKCINKPEILECDPSLLDCFLARIALEEQSSKINLRAFFVENTKRCMEYIKKGGSIAKQGVEGLHKTRKKNHIIADEDALPIFNNSSEIFEERLAKLSSLQRGEVQKFIDNLLEEFHKKDEKEHFAKNSRNNRSSSKNQEKSDKKSKNNENDVDEEFDELQLVESIRAKNIDFTQEDLYLTLLKKIEVFLDAKFGEGYCATLHLTDNVESCYRASLEDNAKHIEVFKKLHKDVIVKYNAINNSDDMTFDERIGGFKIIYGNLMEFAKEINKLNPISESQKDNVESIDVLLFQQGTLKLLKEKNCFKKQLSAQISLAIYESAFYMRYINSMLEVLTQEFPQTYSEIVTARELEKLLQNNIVNTDSIMVGGSINNYIFSLKELIENAITKIEQSLKAVGVPIDHFSAKEGKTYKEFDIIMGSSPEISGEQIVGLVSKFNDLNSLLANVIESGKNKAIKQRFWKIIEQHIQVGDEEYVLMSKFALAKAIIAKHDTYKQYEDITSIKAMTKTPLEALRLDNATMLELIGELLQKDYQELIKSRSDEERE